MRRRLQIGISYLVLAAALPCLSGCGRSVDYGETGTVSGRLTMDGKPLKPDTKVVFMHAEKGFAAFGVSDAEGNFTVDSFNEGNMPIGEYRVMIQPPAEDIDAGEVAPETLLDNPEQANETAKAEFPFKYRQTSTSGLKYPVEAGENRFEIDLEPTD